MRQRAMKGEELSLPARMLLALLGRALGGNDISTALFEKATEADWRSCYRLAIGQGVMAIAWDGVTTLSPSIFPPRTLKLEWAVAVERYEQRYAHYCHTVHELTEFFRPYGIGLMQLKGVGFSTYYPIPAHREGGDIDIRLYSLDLSNMSDEEARLKGEQLIKEQGIHISSDHSEKHNEFHYNGILIESHKSFLNTYNTPEAQAMEEFLQKQSEPVETALMEGEYSINVPSDSFNAVFIGFHAAQHYIQGLALHHLCDWACMLKHGGLQLLPAEIMDPKVMRFIHALTGLSYEYLGTSDVVNFDRKYAHAILLEMINPPYSIEKGETIKNSAWHTFVFKTKRFIHRHKKVNTVFTISLANRLKEVYKNNIGNPARLFHLTGK